MARRIYGVLAALLLASCGGSKAPSGERVDLRLRMTPGQTIRFRVETVNDTTSPMIGIIRQENRQEMSITAKSVAPDGTHVTTLKVLRVWGKSDNPGTGPV